MTDLIGRLAAATGPDRELDVEIARACGYSGDFGWFTPPGGGRLVRCPKFTASIDAALTLLPEGKMWLFGHLDPEDMRFFATITDGRVLGDETWRGFHATPAIALVLAILKARQP